MENAKRKLCPIGEGSGGSCSGYTSLVNHRQLQKGVRK